MTWISVKEALPPTRYLRPIKLGQTVLQGQYLTAEKRWSCAESPSHWFAYDSEIPWLKDAGVQHFESTLVIEEMTYGHSIDFSSSNTITIPKDSILAEAYTIVNGDRNEDYGDPDEDFERTCSMWSGCIGKEVKVWQLPLMMVQLKISRLFHKLKKDSLVDIVGYCLTIEKIVKKKGLTW